VNDKTIYSNYPAEADQNPDYDNLRKMSKEEQKAFLENPEIMTFRIDEYTLPSIVNKLIKSCKKNVKVEMTTTKIDKIHKNFPSKMFDQYKQIKEGDTVKFTVSLYSIKNTSYFYKLTAVEKLAYVERLKGKAGEFFKQQNMAKAAKIYQKVNGYYNFGDVANNYSKEEGPEFDETIVKLMSLKQLCF